MDIQKGKVALVTGGRGGIGRAIVDRLSREGAIVYAADLSETGSLSNDDGTDSLFVCLDVTLEADVISAMNKVRDEQGKLA